MNKDALSKDHEVGGLTAVVHQSQVTKALRNILVNELGFSAEAVRAEMAGLIDRAVENNIANMLKQGEVERLVHVHLNRVLARGDSSTDKLTSIVTNAARDEAVRVVRERVKIEVSKL